MDNVLNIQPKLINVEDLIINKYYVNIQDGICIYKGSFIYEGNNVYAFEFGKIHGITQTLYMKEEELVNLREYNSNNKKPKLTKLRTTEWKKKLDDVKIKINSDAEQLVELYSKRLSMKGFQFDKDTEDQEKFENGFEFQLSKSQKNAINKIKYSMESERITNTLIFGNVGSGKTFVAMSVMFKCAIQGYQTVLLVPSTVLAQQHYNDFIQYFKPYNINIALLTSGIKKSEKDKTIEDIKTGKATVIIATQSILRDNIEFNNLRFMACDEAHKFGTKDKEKLQMLINNLDCIFLTGTIIPRDLMLCKLQLRDMIELESLSVRKPIITKVLNKWDDNIIKFYIEQELKNDGQIFIVYNDIEGLENMKNRILQINNRLKIGILHGKLSKKETAKIMLDFKNKLLDVLIATTVIEVGVNIPNANLMLVYGAERLGMSASMQVKGRIGRSTRQGYCLLIPTDGCETSDTAKQRLRLLEQTDNITGGMILSEADLKIRGSGKVLSKEQSGHFNDLAMGKDFFFELLSQSVQNKKLEKGIN